MAKQKAGAGTSAWLVEGLKRRGQRSGNSADSDRATPKRRPAVGTKSRQWLAVPKPESAAKRQTRKAKAASKSKGPERKSAGSSNGSKPATRQKKESRAKQSRATGSRSKQSRSKDSRTKQSRSKDSRSKDSHRRTRGRSPRERYLDSQLKRAKAKLQSQKEQIARMQAQLSETKESAAEGSADKAPASAEQPDPKAPADPYVAGRRRSSRSGRLDVNRVTFEQLRELGLSVTQSARVIAYRDIRRGFSKVDDLEGVPGLSKGDLAKLRAELRAGPR
jgi:DNA uptake protein ComE-like DNA-binding protein